MLTEKNLQTFDNLQRLALKAMQRHSPDDLETIQAIKDARTASWVQNQGRVSSPVVGSKTNFGVYVGIYHELHEVSGEIWINFTA